MPEEDSFQFFGENRSLFSDYYIAARLQDHPEWGADISEPFQRARALYQANKAALPKMNESQTEKEFIQPILSDVLGHSYDVQHSEKRSGRLNIPDYIFFDDEDSLKEAQTHRDKKGTYYAEARALGDAKYWGRSLDGKGVAEKDRLTNANPSFQIVNYLTVTGLDWGILTNGSQWRLYSMKSRSRIDSYFEVDLQRILEEENKEQFKYFYHFFRAQAYREDPETGQPFVGSVFEGSIDYGSRLEGRLKGLIFDDIFLTLAKGFTEYRANEAGHEEETDASLQEVYQGTLRMLYRLLFILHAESRQLLPLDNRGYRQYSLMELKKNIADRMDRGIPQSSQSFDVWNDLESLFRIIDKGDPDLNVPRYNGGLFRGNHPKNRFLSGHKISDKYLVPALELLTREPDPQTGRKRFIDYKSLNVEQLGSIYEGLLEFHLRIAGELLAIVKEKGREVYKPESEVKNPSAVLEQGELYLENDKGERKATGSYYTPHYIVEYIVEHTLGPVFEERKATFEDLMKRLEPKYEKMNTLEEKIVGGDRSEHVHNKRKQLDLEIRSLENRATEALLSIKICDPAMGSGHFLKEATDKLAEMIITLLAQYPINPVTKLLEEVRKQILQSLSEQEITIDAEEHLKDTNLIKRMVMKRCIYGVDLNPMAVELAKLSLWLDSFTVGAPLSFLNHHLKTGNSLIGTTVGEIREQLETGQSHLFGGPFSGLLKATELMREVSVKTDATYSEVEQSIERYRDFEGAVKPYKQVLDIWLSRYFGNERAGDFLVAFSDQITNLLQGQDVQLGDQQQAIIEKARNLQREKAFFHWELEFPEVFVDLKHSKWLENPGFDAVVGNPPYDVLEKERLADNHPHKDLNEYLKHEEKYDAASGGKQNLFRPFLIKVNGLINKNGVFGKITPLALLTDQSCSKTLKSLLKTKYDFEIQAFPQKDIPNDRVFSEAKLSTCIIIVKAFKSEARIKVSTNPGRKILSESKTYTTSLDELKSITDSLAIPLAGKNEWRIIEKIYLSTEKNSIENLTDLTRGEINQTIFRKYITGNNNNEELLKGSQVGVYHEHEPSQGVIEWFDNELYEKENGTTKDPPRKRIALQRISGVDDTRRLTGTFVNRKAHFADSLNSLASDDEETLKFVLSLLNAKLINWCFNLFSTNNNISTGELADLPIRKIDFSKFNPDKNTEFPDQLARLYQQYLEGQDAEELLALTQNLISDEEVYRLPFIHDFLADLAGRMLEFHKEKQRLNEALDPFKFLNKGVAFATFSDAFSEAIKYGRQLTEEIDIGTVHHDIEGLKLEPENPSDRLERSDGSDKQPWLLKLHLKHRDPETGWADWVKDDGTIVRSSVPVFRFNLAEEEARYWQQALEVLDEFANSRTIPGGKTRTTHKKLMKTRVPVFDESANIQPLIELREELAEVNQKIEKTDGLIDQVVYQLYGLSEEEIAVVENSI